LTPAIRQGVGKIPHDVLRCNGDGWGPSPPNVDDGEKVMETPVDAVKKAVLPVLRRHEVIRAGIFGSCARDDMTAESDIDVLVEIRPDISLLDFIGIKLEIEQAIGKEVDLVEYDAIKPPLRDRILREQVVIL
jgi:predicted nucleotidyltransferase